MFFIKNNKVPQDEQKDVTCGRIVYKYRSQEAEKNRTHITVGGDRMHYLFDCGTASLELMTVNLLLNSVFSTSGVKFMTLNIKTFDPNTTMRRYEYYHLKCKFS